MYLGRVFEGMEKIRKEKKKIGRIPVAPPTQEHKDKSKYSRKKKHKEDLVNNTNKSNNKIQRKG